MPTIGTTRFNSQTWKENMNWRQANNYKGCIYGTPVRTNENITTGDIIFIIEMKNDENKVGGIGLVKNLNYADKYYKIYKDGNYNRYVYKSDYRIDRSELTPYEAKVIEIFDTFLFTGSKHLKRGQGITGLQKWLIANKHIDFIKFFKTMFLERYKKNNICDLNI
jgi:hypothetical protein